MRLPSAAQFRERLPARLPWEPWSVLVPLAVVEWLGIAVEARRLHHNGWVFGRGRTETMYSTSAWLLGNGHLPHPLIGFGWPVVLAPFTWFTGANLLSLLPPLVVLQVVLLVPLGALGAYALGSRAADSRLVGYLSAAVWTLGPFVGAWYFSLDAGWRQRILPELLGLTARPELPSAAALLVAAVLVLRVLDRHRLVDAAAAGGFAGLAIAIVPANVLFLAAPAVAFAAARRWRALGVFAAGLVPAAIGVLVWSERGAGHASLLLPHWHFMWSLFKVNWFYLIYSSWSARVLHWIALAGFVGLLKRSPVKALFFGVWLGAYSLAEGTSNALRGYEDSFFHLLIPTLPAFCVLLASLPLLWPRADMRIPARWPYAPGRTVPLAVPALLVAVVPLVWLLVASPLHSRTVAIRVPRAGLFVPLHGPNASATTSGGRVTISWPTLTAAHAQTAYAVYRSPAGNDMTCSTRGATDCVLNMQRLATTGRTTFSDKRGAGTFAYRVGLVANAPGMRGPLLSLGPAVTVRVR